MIIRIAKLALSFKSVDSGIPVVPMYKEAKLVSTPLKALVTCAKPSHFSMAVDAIPQKTFSSLPALIVLTSRHASFVFCPIASVGKVLTCIFHRFRANIASNPFVFFLK